MPARKATKLDKAGKEIKRSTFVEKINKYLGEYEKLIIVKIDNISSHQLQKIRKEMRGQAQFLMAKNTMAKKALRIYSEKHPQYLEITHYLTGNVGFVFTHDNLLEVRKKLTDLSEPSPAKVGFIAPCDVIVPAGDTGLDPSQTSFFHALNIGSKITKGKIEILSDVHLIKKGDKVGANEATLLQKLDMRPFLFGIELVAIFENNMILDAAVLDINEQMVLDSLAEGVKNITALSQATNVSTLATIPFSIVEGLQSLLGLAFAANVQNELIDKIKASAEQASAAPVAAAPVEKKEEKKPEKVVEEKKEEKKVEEEEEEVEFFDIFG